MLDYQSKPESKEPSDSGGKFLTPFQRQLLQKKLQEDCVECYRQRIEIMLLADEGRTQTEICQILGCCAATARHWIHIARMGMAHQWQDCPIGRPKTVDKQYLERLQELVSSNPRDYGYSFRCWTANWLQKHLAKEFGIEVSDRHIKRLLKEMGLSTRQKSSHITQNSLKSDTETKILIADLKTANTPDSSEFLLINFAKLAKDSDTYGAQSVRSVGISATNQQYFGIFTDGRGILSLSSTT